MTADKRGAATADERLTVADLLARNAELERRLRSNARLAAFNLVLKKVIATLVEFSDPEEALRHICSQAVAEAGFVLGWVGVQDDRLKRIVPTYACGPAAGYVDEVIITTDPALVTSHGPARLSMIEGRIVYSNDYLTDAITEPWHDLARRYDIASAASIPLKVRGKTRRVIAFYSSQRDYFDADLRDVLEESARLVSQAMAAAEAERALRSRNQLLSDMSDMALIGAWEMDPRTARITGSDEAADILDVDQADAFDQDDVMGLFPAPDAAVLRAAVAEAVGTGAPFDVELGIVTRAGRSKWLRVIGRADVVEGRVTRLFGAVQDITRSKQRDLALQDSQKFNQGVFDSLSAEIAVLDKDGVIIAVNEPWRRFAEESAGGGGCPVGVIGVGADYLAACRSDPDAPDDLAERIGEGIRQVIDRRAPFFAAEYACHPPGEERWCSLRVTPMELSVGGVVAVHTDITERRQAEAVLAESEERYRSLMMAMAEGVVLQDENAAILAFNDSATRILGLTADQLRGRTSFDPRWRSIHEDGSPFAGDTHPVVRALRTGLPQSNVVMGLYRPDDSLAWISGSAQPLFRPGAATPHRVVATMYDITEQRRIEDELLRTARFDTLTGLLNRGSFTQAVRDAVAAAGRDDRLTAAMLLDIDNFKDVNDTLGHGAGDRLLKALSERLTRAVGDAGIVARFGGDEFGVLLTPVDRRSRIDGVARRLLEAIGRPLRLDGAELRIGASLGVAVVDPAVADAETLLSRADIALYRAKDQGRGVYRYFTEEMDLAVRRRVTLGRELRTAIEAGQLLLFYQPQVDADTGAVIGVEALVRWNHPERGVVGPAEFIPISESLGLAGGIGRWVIGEACRQIRAWLDAGLTPPVVAVNLSATQFAAPGELERDLAEAMARHGVTPDRLELELTETVLMEASAEHSDALMRLRESGFRLSIDDFGTGYSSLDYLRRFPADRIKIDQNFVKDMHSTPGNEAIVKAIIGLARQLGMGVIAEGVETLAHRDLLRQWDCREMQGYYFSRPAAAAVIGEFLRTGQRLPV